MKPCAVSAARRASEAESFVLNGDTLDEVKSEIREAVTFHVEGLRQNGRPIPKPSSAADFVEAPDEAA